MAPKKPAKKVLSKAAQRRADKEAAAAAEKEAITGGPGKLPECLENAVITGVLESQPQAQDIKIGSFSVTTFGKELVRDTTLELTYGNRYGLVGSNGSGKSTILYAIAHRQVPVPESFSIWHLDREAEPEDESALQCVINVVSKEQERLEALQLELLQVDPDSPLLEAIADKLGKMEPSTFESEASRLLYGLGFSPEMVKRSTRDMSGGWRMRVALAQALFAKPTILLLDEPTNHLDLGACVWLEDYLKDWSSILIIISHSQDFLNGVCTNILQLTAKGTLVTWGGNYDAYVRTRKERETNELKKYEKEQADIEHLQEFIRSCGTYANLRKQADSKQKIIDKMVAAGLTEKPEEDKPFDFTFPSNERLAPPIMAFNDVAFSYSGKPEDFLYTKLNFGVDMDSRIALVGPNGAGKSTLLKMMRGELEPVEGEVKKHGHLRIGQYNQHSEEILDLQKNPLDFFQALYPDGIITAKGQQKMEPTDWRRYLGSFGISQDRQTRTMSTLSHGLQTRVCMMMIALRNPHMLLLDEPTNHLDMECIDGLARAINKFQGGLVLVSHDFRLIGQVAKEIWVCDNKTIEPWKGTIQSYKADLQKKDRARHAKMMKVSGH
eukprot:GEMP01013993.1.p1 GENE.GEMP01013993.1~~GEMP01013993.1.p1  ORF type:complete len:609 (+),score=110.65 GEMP01013993.1:104-1930(+)